MQRRLGEWQALVSRIRPLWRFDARSVRPLEFIRVRDLYLPLRGGNQGTTYIEDSDLLIVMAV